MSESGIPRRALGRTGEQVTIVGLGGEGVLRTHGHERDAAAVIARALDLGITYFDTAPAYASSRDYLGATLGERRKGIFLASKTAERSRDGSLRVLDDSLRRLRTDHLDLWQLHDLRTLDDLDEIFSPKGAIHAATQAHDEGRVRYVGITGHHDPAILLEAMRRFDFDTALVALNCADLARMPFTRTVLPEAAQRNMGVIAMKVYSAGNPGRAPRIVSCGRGPSLRAVARRRLAGDHRLSHAAAGRRKCRHCAEFHPDVGYGDARARAAPSLRRMDALQSSSVDGHQLLTHAILPQFAPHPIRREAAMPEKETLRRAQEDRREGKSASTQAGEFVREEMHHIREGKHGAKNTKQAIAIGLSKARRSGVKLSAPKKGKASSRTRKQAKRDLRKGASGRKKTSSRRSRAVRGALKKMGRSAASKKNLSRQGRTAARKRSSSSRQAAAKKAVRTKGPQLLKRAARKAARTRERKAA